MGKAQPLPILIADGGHRIGLALAWHLINQRQPIAVSYRTHHLAIDGLTEAGAQCIQVDFSTDDGVMALADEVLKSTHGLRVILYNASAWMAGKPGMPLIDVLVRVTQIHVSTPRLLDHTLEGLLHGHEHAASDITRFIGYMVERGNDKHITYAASKAASDNVTRSFAHRLIPEVKVSSIIPSPILFNGHDGAEYRQQTLGKSLTKTVPGEKEVIDLVNYLLASYFVAGYSFPLDDGRHLR